MKDKIELTEEMVNTLENPPKANDAFKAAAKKYKGEDIKKADTTLWLDNNGYRTLDNFSKKELAYYHSSDVKTLKGVVDGLTQQVAELRAVIIEANDYLNFNNLTSIGHGSGLHESFKYALREGE